MPGTGRAADPLWFAIGFAIGFLPSVYFRQVGFGVALDSCLGLLLHWSLPILGTGDAINKIQLRAGAGTITS